MKPETTEKGPGGGTSGTLSASTNVSGDAVPDLTDRLDTWKEIAVFVGRDERTAMRWAKDQGMPIHHGGPRAKRRRVYASRTEIREWLALQRADSPAETDVPRQSVGSVTQVSTPLQPKSTKWYAIAGVAIVVLAAVITAIVLRRPFHASLPAKASFIGDALMAVDVDGKTLWTYKFHRNLDPAVNARSRARFARTADLFGDGDRQVIAVVPYAAGPNEKDGVEFEIQCFSSRGKLLWSYAPRESFQFGTHDVHGPWRVIDLIVSRRGPKKAIYVGFAHHLWGNSFVAELDPTSGHGTVRYVNTGDIYVLDEIQTSGATYLVAGGFNNEHDGGSAALIDERRPFAASPQTEGTRHKCTSCPEGSPDYYFVFPRSEGNRLLKDYINPIDTINVVGSEVEFWKSEPNGPYIDAIYLVGLEPSIRPISLRYGSSYDLQHRERERSGELRHTLEQCPERLHPSPVRMWTPSTGWADLRFEPNRFDQ